MPTALYLGIAALFTTLNWLSYSDPKGQFTVTYPESWELSVVENTVSLYTAIESDSDQFRENVSIAVQDLTKYPSTLAQYTQGNKDWVTEAGGTLHMDREVTVSGEPATEIAYSMPPSSMALGVEVTFHQICILKGANAYLITYTALPQSYATFDSLSAEIIKSFTLAK